MHDISEREKRIKLELLFCVRAWRLLTFI